MKQVGIKHITGDALSDGNEALKVHFRELLKEEWDVDNYEFWIKECLENNYNKELQDIIVSLGAKLGFEIEYGLYAGKPGHIGADGIWKRPRARSSFWRSKRRLGPDQTSSNWRDT